MVLMDHITDISRVILGFFTLFHKKICLQVPITRNLKHYTQPNPITQPNPWIHRHIHRVERWWIFHLIHITRCRICTVVLSAQQRAMVKDMAVARYHWWILPRKCRTLPYQTSRIPGIISWLDIKRDIRPSSPFYLSLLLCVFRLLEDWLDKYYILQAFTCIR